MDTLKAILNRILAVILGKSPYDLAQLDTLQGKRLVYVVMDKKQEVIIQSYPRIVVDGGTDWTITVTPVADDWTQTIVKFSTKGKTIEWPESIHLRFPTLTERRFGVK